METPLNSSDQSPSLHSPSPADANPSDKRKREEEPDSEALCDLPAPTPPQHPLWKTSLCSFFRRTGGTCSHGETCRYAHGEAELRPRLDNTWDPTSDRAKKIARTDADKEEPKAADVGVMMTEALETQGEESSSELSKCLVNLPMKWSADQFRNYLTEQGILFKSAKKKKGMIVGFVTFENSAQAKRGVEELDGKIVGNNRTLKVSDVIPRPFEQHNKAAIPPDSAQETENLSRDGDSTESTNNNDVDDDGNLILNGSVAKGRSARDVVTPLAHMSYADQLEHKKNSLAQLLKKLTRNARKACPNGVSLPEWILKSREIGNLPCQFEGIIESPIVNRYRNKCEFSVGLSLDGKRTVGFLLGNFREGVTAVEEPIDCPNVSRLAWKYASIFQEFLQHSQLPLWNRLNNSGFWRQLTVREGRGPCEMAEVDNSVAKISEAMLIVQVNTVSFDKGVVDDELQHLAQAFSEGSSADSSLPLTALVIQDHTGISNAAPPDAPLRTVYVHKGDCGLVVDGEAEPRIHDHISNLRFSLSPSAFFQVNTPAAEKLYSLAGDWAGLGSDTLLFDICCGTGTIGLTLAHRVGMVVGIEMNASAVSDAQRNAEINGIKNCRFVCGKAEDVIGSLMKEYLSLPQTQDIKDASLNAEAAEENANSADKVLGTEAGPILDCSMDGDVKDGSQLEKHRTSAASTPLPQYKNVVAIVDPPRVGLHPTVIKVMRTQSRLRRLVYISCNPESLVANAIELCTPSLVDKSEKVKNNGRGWRNMSSAGLARQRVKSMPNSEPFSPIKAMAVDLFPHTPHCELVMLMER